MENKKFTIENECLRVVASSKGGELQSVYDKRAQRELLWQGDARYWEDKAPNLFPYIARLTNGTYTWQGKEYQMKIHGFVMYSYLECTENGEELCFELKANEATRAHYPFEFVYWVRYRIEGTALLITYEVENKDSRKMYFGIGAHPGFQVPFVPETEFEDYYLEFGEGVSPSRILFSDDCFVLGKEPFDGLEGSRLALKHSLFDEDAIVLENMGGKVTLKCKKASASVCVEYGDIAYLGLWHCPRTEAPYVCIEPWSSLPSRKGIVEDLEKQGNLLSLMPGETCAKTIRITITE